MSEDNKNKKPYENNDLNGALITGGEYPERLILLSVPVTSRVIFPMMMLPFNIDNELSEYMLGDAMKSYGAFLGIAAELEEDMREDKSHGKLFHVGVLARVLQYEKERHTVLMNTVVRFKIEEILQNEPYIVARVSYDEEKIDDDDDVLKSYVTALVAKVKELVKNNPIFTEEIRYFMKNYGLQNPVTLTDTISSLLVNSGVDKLLEVLESFKLKDRIEKVLHMIQKEIEISNLKEKINKDIEKKLSKQQREFFLREQLSHIKKELGLEKDDKSEEVLKFEKKLAKMKLPADAKKVAFEELDKLKMYDTRSSEYSVSRNYLQWICDIPWGVWTKDLLDLRKIKKTLDAEHFGMEEVKDRILEFVAIQKLKKSTLGTVLLLVGPPGVGKTSLAMSIARALGRKSYNFSLGAMRDEAELKGHRRTYVGALPGKMVQALKSTQSSNPVIILDEIDKIGASYKGDPSSALLEILDPEQNNQFLDHYLDLRVDLSQVLFIATANQLDTILEPILDRMEIIQLSGYTMEEKIEIAKRYVIPKVLNETGVSSRKVKFTDDVLRLVVNNYARESGVRRLQQMIRKMMRKVALEMVSVSRHRGFTFKEKDVVKYLGQERFKIDRVYDEVVPGIVTGLAWTSVGGATLYVEAQVFRKQDGAGEMKLTGRLGETMRESAQIAYSYAQLIANDMKLDKDFFTNNKIHLHVPEGATPKDGPSAGITMTLALISLLMGKSVPSDIAMTGELTISGKVLPIGGVKEKIMAGRRVGKKTLIFPMENKKDVDELPEINKEGINIKYVSTFKEVLKAVGLSK